MDSSLEKLSLLEKRTASVLGRYAQDFDEFIEQIDKSFHTAANVQAIQVIIEKGS